MPMPEQNVLAAVSPSQTEGADFSVTVTTTARLHFGFFDPSGRTSEPFGSFGLSLDEPATRLNLRHAQEDHAQGPESERAARYLTAMKRAHGVERAYGLDIAEAIPPHAGLGSGTQLALALGAAFSAIENLNLSPAQIAEMLGRGARSGIGIATFKTGGAVIDSGPAHGALPQLIARAPFPDGWRVLLIFDAGTKGLQGADEVAAFETSPIYPEDARTALCARVVERALPALERGDFDVFCEEVGHLQARMGDYFAPSQGGVFTSPDVGTVLEALRARGIAGVGQSSWGPTGFAFAETEQDGQRLLALATQADKSGSLRFVLAKGRNEGAKISRLSGLSRSSRQ
ncbi:MAG: beta-ribofuranosylaminobenzene 5'-phosphate synthase family protein [Pseudomonadota bacterium]